MLSSIFGGNTGLTYEELQRRKVLAARMMPRQTARTFGGGIGNAGRSIAAGLMARAADNAEDENAEYSDEVLSGIFGGMPTAAAPPTGAPAAVTPAAPAPSGGSLVDGIINIESAGKADAKNPRSSATGLGQFIDSTWLSMINKYKPDLAAGKGRAEILAMRTNPELSREMTGLYAKENADMLTGAGHSATPGNVYLAHFLGPAGAKKVLASSDSTPMSSLFSPEIIKANPLLGKWTVGDTKAFAARKMGGAPAAAPATPAPARPDNRARLQQLMTAASDPRLTPQVRQLVNVMLAQEMAKNAPADPYKQWSMDRAGRQDALSREKFAETKRMNDARLAGDISDGTTVNVNMEGEKAFEKESAKSQAKAFDGWMTDGVTAKSEMANVIELRRLINEEGVGGTSDAWMKWAQDKFGVSMVDGPVAAYDSIISRLIPQQRPPGSGTTSDRDMELFRKALPSMVGSPEGNNMILDTMQAMLEYRVKLGEISARVMMDPEYSRQQGTKDIYALPDPMSAFKAKYPDGVVPGAKAAASVAPAARPDSGMATVLGASEVAPAPFVDAWKESGETDDGIILERWHAAKSGMMPPAFVDAWKGFAKDEGIRYDEAAARAKWMEMLEKHPADAAAWARKK